MLLFLLPRLPSRPSSPPLFSQLRGRILPFLSLPLRGSDLKFLICSAQCEVLEKTGENFATRSINRFDDGKYVGLPISVSHDLLKAELGLNGSELLLTMVLEIFS
jgi:hypothetical protein